MFEIHITVDCDITDFHLFQEACKDLGVKPLAIYLNSDKHNYHIMTSSIFYGDFCNLFEELNRICVGLKTFTILRRKVETHPRFIQENDHIESTLYYEVHIQVDNLLLNLLPDSLVNKWYVSNNFNKPDYTLLTCRLYDWQEHITIENDYKLMVDSGMLLDNTRGVIYEFAILDTNPELDNNWMQ